ARWRAVPPGLDARSLSVVILSDRANPYAGPSALSMLVRHSTDRERAIRKAEIARSSEIDPSFLGPLHEIHGAVVVDLADATEDGFVDGFVDGFGPAASHLPPAGAD